MADKPHIDKPFRRSLFITLMAIGLIASGAFFYARDAKEGQRAAIAERNILKQQLATLLDGQAKLLERQQQSDAFIASVLAGSSDPVVAGALQQMKVPVNPSTDRRATPTRSSQPRPQPTSTATPRPTPRPSPAPSPAPFPVPLPAPLPTCLPLLPC